MDQLKDRREISANLVGSVRSGPRRDITVSAFLGCSVVGRGYPSAPHIGSVGVGWQPGDSRAGLRLEAQT